MPQKKRKEKRTYADRAEYLKKAVKKRRRLLRKRACERMGAKCMICGYSKCQNALDFHHKDARKKEFGISARGLTRSWEKIKKEVDKCVLLCANCHREVHAGITRLPKER